MCKNSDQAPVVAQLRVRPRPPPRVDRTRRVSWEPRDKNAYWVRVREL